MERIQKQNQIQGQLAKSGTMTTGTPWKQIIIFALPMIAGNILQQLYNTVDTIVVGNFDSQAALSAVGTCVFLVNFYLAIAQGFSIGAGVIIAQQYGAGKEQELKKSSYTAMIVLLALGLVSTVIALITSRWVLISVMSVPASLLNMAEVYFKIFAAGLIFQFGYNIIAAMLRAVGDSKATLYFLLVSSGINVVLDLLFVAVFHWGVAGAAAATVISQAGSFLASILYMRKNYPIFAMRIGDYTVEWKVIRQLLKTGAPMAVQQIIVSCGFMFIQRLVHSYGEAMTASFTVATRLENYLLIPTIALQNTMATYCGQNKGAGRKDRIMKGIFQTILISCSITLLFSIVTFFLSDSVISLFGLTGQSALYCREHIRFVSFAFVIFAAYFPCLGLYQGIGEGVFATLVSTIVLGTRILFSYSFSTIPAIGYACVWLCVPLCWILAAVVNYIHFFTGKWQKTIS